MLLALRPAHVMAVISIALLAAPAHRTGAFGVGESPADDVLVAAAFLGEVAALNMPRPVVGSITFVVGLALGLDSPSDAISLRDAVRGLVGTWWAGATLLAAAIATATPLARLWNGIATACRGLRDRSDGPAGPGPAVGLELRFSFSF
jgi:hypothetical protein